MTRTGFGRLLVALPALLFLAGCSHVYSSPVADHWGEAQRELVADMIVDPDGAEQVPTGLDAGTGAQTMQGYRSGQAQRRTPASGASIINIGTGAR